MAVWNGPTVSNHLRRGGAAPATRSVARPRGNAPQFRVADQAVVAAVRHQGETTRVADFRVDAADGRALAVGELKFALADPPLTVVDPFDLLAEQPLRGIVEQAELLARTVEMAAGAWPVRSGAGPLDTKQGGNGTECRAQ